MYREGVNHGVIETVLLIIVNVDVILCEYLY